LALQLWRETSEPGQGRLIPFSAGPGVCPAHYLVPLLGSLARAALLLTVAPALQKRLGVIAGAPMPGTLDNFRLRFALAPWPAAR
jgi:hypothetical protein